MLTAEDDSEAQNRVRPAHLPLLVEGQMCR